MDTGSFCFDTLLSYRRHLRSDLTPHGGAHCPGPKWPGLRHGPPKLASPHRSAVPLVHVPEACQSPELLLSTLMSGHVHITSIQLGGLLSICYRFCHYPAKETWLILTFPVPRWFLNSLTPCSRCWVSGTLLPVLGLLILYVSLRWECSLRWRCSLHWGCSLKQFAHH